MERTYSYDKTRYFYRVKLTGYFMLLCIVWFGYQFAMKPGWNIYILAIVAAVYGALNTFVFNSNVKDIIIDDDTITFAAFKKITYRITDIKAFQLKEQANASYFLRVEDKNGKKRRFWINYYYFSDKIELANELYFIEKRIDPKHLKFKGREKMFNVRPCYLPENQPSGGNKLADEKELPGKSDD